MSTTPRISTFLMFEGNAEEAMNFYVSLLPGSRVESIERFGPAGPGKEGTVMQATFTLAGQWFKCFDSFVKHKFTFTPAISIFINCDSEAELDALYEKLSASGQALMPLGNYGFSKKFGWVNDRFGVSWQMNLP